jgi:FixJ family two-component response regulator
LQPVVFVIDDDAPLREALLSSPFGSSRDHDMLDTVRVALERDRARREEEKVVVNPREREVIAFIVSGLMNKQMLPKPALAKLPQKKVHRGKRDKKMGAKSAAELVRIPDEPKCAHRLGCHNPPTMKMPA